MNFNRHLVSPKLTTLIAGIIFYNCFLPHFPDLIGKLSAEESAQLKLSESADCGLSAEMLADGWISLFDGESLYGWRAESKADWQVADGLIRATSGESGLLRTSAQFDDFVLRVDFRSPQDTNSGIFIRTSPQPSAPAKDCYEINIADQGTSKFPTGSIVDRAVGAAVKDQNEWQTFEITANGKTVDVSVDGTRITHYVDENPLGRGYIGLQFRSGKIEFRNILLKPLNTKPLFNGIDLDGWKTYPEMESEFSVVDQLLHVQGGKGQLETKEKFADFTLQLECRTNAPRLNSGVFFRCIPGEAMNGYESQIHNGFINDDRTQPEDCGTGGIFRRQNARKVIANDQEWFYKTIVAEGAHFCVWVNGIQVTDFTDQRQPHDNPRNGLRRAAGTIMLQGHDPTTDIDFRNLRIGELAPRRLD